MGKISPQLSAETQGLLAHAPEFFQALVDNYEKTKLDFLPFSPEAQTEVQKLSNGDIQITFIYPLDDDGDPQNGRLYLKDKFVFDSNEQNFRREKYERTYQRNLNVPDPEGKWEALEKLYTGSAKLDDKQITIYAEIVARSFARPLTPALFAKIQGQAKFFERLSERISSKELMVDFLNPRNHYTIINKGLTTELIFSFIAIDNNTDAEGNVKREKKAGEVLLQERFTVLTNNGDFLGHKEVWDITPKTENEEHWKGVAEALTQGAKPTKDEAKVFLSAFMPDLLNKPIDLSGKVEEGPPQPPPSGWKPFTPAVFDKLRDGAFARHTEVARKDIPSQFFAKMSEYGKEHFAPLQEALGSAYTLDLANPPMTVHVGVQGANTNVDLKFRIPAAVQGEKPLIYSERLVFEGATLKEIQRHVEGPETDAAKALRAKIEEKKFLPLDAPSTQAVRQLVSTFVAPHVNDFGGIVRVLDNKDAETSLETKVVLKTLRSMEAGLIPLMYLPTVDPKFRAPFLTALSALQRNDPKALEMAELALKALQGYAKESLAQTKDVDQMLRIQEFGKMGDILYALVKQQDLAKARKLAESLQSPQIRSAMLTPVAHLENKGRLVEGLDVMMNVALDQVAKRHHDSKAWLTGGAVTNKEGETKAVKALFEKAILRAAETHAKDPLAVLGELELTDDMEKAARSRIQNDRVMEQVNCIAQERNREVQGHNYYQLAKTTLFDEKLLSSARYVAVLVAISKLPKSAALENLSLAHKVGLDRLVVQQKSVITELQATKATMPTFMQIAGGALEENPGITAPEILSGFGAWVQATISKLPQVENEEERTKMQAELLAMQQVQNKLATDPLYQKLLQASTGGKPEERFAKYAAILNEVPDPEVQKLAPELPKLFNGLREQLKQEAGGEMPAAMEGLMIMMALEGKRGEEQQLKLQKATQVYDSLIKKANQYALSRPNEGSVAILKAIKDEELSAEEKTARDLLVKDSFVAKISEIAGKSNPDERLKLYMELYEKKEFEKHNAPGTLAWMGSQIQQKKFPEMPAGAKNTQDLAPSLALSKNVGEFIAMTEGRGSFATKVEYGVPRFVDELSKPTTIGAMVASGGLGAFAEFRVFAALNSVKPVAALGWKGRTAYGLTAATASILVEGTAFAFTNKLGESAFYSAENQWGYTKADGTKVSWSEQFFHEAGSNALLFAGMRIGHFGAGKISEHVFAPGRKGFGWAGGVVEGEAGRVMSVSPLGKVTTRATAPNGVPQLTVAGERATALLNHTFGIGAMWGSGYVARGLHWQEGPQQDAKGHLADAFLGYLHAHMGFGLANRATGHKFQEGVGILKMSTQVLKTEGAKAPKVEILKGDTRLLDLSTLPDLRMVNLATPNKAKNIRLSVDTETGIDAVLLGAKGDSIKVKADEAGKVFILDTRVEPAKPEKAEPKAEPKAEEPKAEEPKAEEPKAEEPKAEEPKAEEPKAEEPKAEEPKAEEPKAEEPKAEEPKAEEPKPTHDPLEIHNADGVKTVKPGEWTELGLSDLLVVGGKQVALSMPKTSPIHLPLAKLSRERQLSIAKKIGKAKDPQDLLERLRGVHYEGSGDVITAVSMVFNGKLPLHQLPGELGLQAKVRKLISAEVERFEKEGFDIPELAGALKVRNSQWSPLELNYQAGRQMEIFNSRMAAADNFKSLLATVLSCPFETLQGVRPETLLRDLQIGGLKEAQLQAEVDLTSAQKKLTDLQHNAGETRGEILKTRNVGKKKELKDMVAEYDKRIEEQHEAVAEAKETVKAISGFVDEVTKDPSTGGTLTPEQLVEQLPAAGGLRQKARDLLDSKGYEDNIASRNVEKPNKQEKHEIEAEKKIIKLVKKSIFYQIDAGEKTEGAQNTFILAQKLLRHAIDNGTPQAKALLRNATPAEKELLLATYFGHRPQRDVINPAKAFETLAILGQTGPGARIRLNYEASGDKLKANMVFTALETKDEKAPGQDFQLMVLNPKGEKPQDILPSEAELGRAVKQATKYAEAGYPEKLGDNALFDKNNSELRTWIVGEKGVSVIEVRLGKDGKPEKIFVRSALEKPVGKDKQPIELDTKALQEKADALKLPIEFKTEDYPHLLREMPFSLNPLTRFQKFSRWTSQIDIPLPKPVKKAVDLAKDGGSWIASKFPKKKPKMIESDKPKGDKPEAAPDDTAPDSKKDPKTDPKADDSTPPEGSTTEPAEKGPKKVKGKKKKEKATVEPETKPEEKPETKPEDKADDKTGSEPPVEGAEPKTEPAKEEKAPDSKKDDKVEPAAEEAKVEPAPAPEPEPAPKVEAAEPDPEATVIRPAIKVEAPKVEPVKVEEAKVEAVKAEPAKEATEPKAAVEPAKAETAIEPVKAAEESFLQGMKTFFSMEQSPRLQALVETIKHYWGRLLAAVRPTPKEPLAPERVTEIHDNIEADVRAHAKKMVQERDLVTDIKARTLKKFDGEMRVDLDTGKILQAGEKAKREHKIEFTANMKDNQFQYKGGEKALLEKKAGKEKDPTRKAVLEGLARLEGETLQLRVKPESLIGGVDARVGKIIIPAKAEVALRNAKGVEVGKAQIVAGGEEGKMKARLDNGTFVSVETSIGDPAYGKIQDGGLIATQKVRVNGEEVEVLYVAASDGAGGSGHGGHVASSAFLHGAQAEIAQAALEGRVAMPKDIMAAGLKAVTKQTELTGPYHKDSKPTGGALVQVFIGDQVFMGSIADVMGTVAVPNIKGKYKIKGTTHNQNIGPAVIATGIHENNPMFWQAKVKKGTRVNGGSDGFWGAYATDAYKANAPHNLRIFLLGEKGEVIPEVSHDMMRPFTRTLDATAGNDESGFRLHDIARDNNLNPGQEVEVAKGIKIQMPAEKPGDNIVISDTQIGDVKPLKKPIEVDADYRELLPVEGSKKPGSGDNGPKSDPPSSGDGAKADSTAEAKSEGVPPTVDDPAPKVAKTLIDEPVPPTVDDPALAGPRPAIEGEPWHTEGPKPGMTLSEKDLQLWLSPDVPTGLLTGRLAAEGRAMQLDLGTLPSFAGLEIFGDPNASNVWFNTGSLSSPFPQLRIPVRSRQPLRLTLEPATNVADSLVLRNYSPNEVEINAKGGTVNVMPSQDFNVSEGAAIKLGDQTVYLVNFPVIHSESAPPTILRPEVTSFPKAAKTLVSEGAEAPPVVEAKPEVRVEGEPKPAPVEAPLFPVGTTPEMIKDLRGKVSSEVRAEALVHLSEGSGDTFTLTIKPGELLLDPSFTDLTVGFTLNRGMRKISLDATSYETLFRAVGSVKDSRYKGILEELLSLDNAPVQVSRKPPPPPRPRGEAAPSPEASATDTAPGPKAPATEAAPVVEPKKAVPPPPPAGAKKAGPPPPPPARAKTEGKGPPPMPGASPEIAAIHSRVASQIEGAVQDYIKKFLGAADPVAESRAHVVEVELNLEAVTGSPDFKGQMLTAKFNLDPATKKIQLEPGNKELLTEVLGAESDPKLLAVLKTLIALEDTAVREPVVLSPSDPVKELELFLGALPEGSITPVRAMEDGLMVFGFPDGVSRVKFGRNASGEPVLFDQSTMPPVLRVNDASVAETTHAEIGILGNEAKIFDYGSKEGTFLEGPQGKVKLNPFTPTLIQPGQKFFLGTRGFIFRGRQ